MIKCIIFDLDGTLVDSEPLCTQAFLDLLPEIDTPLPELTEYFRGRKFAWMLNDLELRLGCRLSREFEVQYREHVDLLFETRLHAFDGVLEALKEISMPICIASSGPRAKIERALEITKLRCFFGSRIFSSYEVGIWKPDPGLFLHAAKTMNTPEHECLVVEDSEVGIEAAKSAGMHVLQFCRERDTQPSATLFTSYKEFPQALLRRRQ